LKNIILLGPPNSGKRTFSEMILKKFPEYNLIHQETVFASYRKTVVELAQKRKEDPLKIEFDGPFMRKMLLNLFDLSVRKNPNLKFLLESRDLSLEDLLKYQDNNTMVLVFGYPRVSLEEKMKSFNGKESVEYLHTWALKRIVSTSIIQSKNYKKDCKNFKINFVDTSKNQEKVLNKLFTWFLLENQE